MQVADHFSAVKRRFESRAMPAYEKPPAKLVDIYCMAKQKEAVEASQSYNRLYFLTPSVISQRYKKYVAILVSNVHKRTKTDGDRTVFAIR